MSRVLGLDYGRKRIGVAISDPLGTFAQPETTIEVANPGEALPELERICAEREVTRVVVGIPLDQNGEPGPMAEEVRRWSEKLADKLDIPIILRDERFSSQWAERVELETRSGGNQRKRKRRDKARVDALAAQAILEDYLRAPFPVED